MFLHSGCLGVLHSDTETVIKTCFENVVKTYDGLCLVYSDHIGSSALISVSLGENLQKVIAVAIFIYVSHHKNDSWPLFAVFKITVTFGSVNFSVST
jgi:hypothetical protein